MKILFDQGTPVPLRKFLSKHDVSTAYEQGWSTLENGDLISEAERSGFNLILTTDKNVKYQQNLSERRIAIIVLIEPSWPKLKRRIEEIAPLIDAVEVNGYLEI